ncbi:histidine--tRNA ligase [bacterium]|nr:MAG: histidine--tRNA ligase [bacterium]
MRIQAPRGTEDVTPDLAPRWRHVEETFRALAARYGYGEIRTPTFEETSLFVRGVGDTTDIVTKELYSFRDKGDRDISLKPEGTAGAVRAVLEHSLCPPGTVLRLSYVTPIYRYERPQKGRLREAHQLGLEILGSSSPTADAEVIEVTSRTYAALGLPETVVLLNSLGRTECRLAFRSAVLNHMAAYLQDQGDEVRAKAERNPLRLLDSKDPAAQEALRGLPPITDFLEDDSRSQFERLQQLLTDAGIAYRLDPGIVRGLDYYTGTVFEVHSTALGAQGALCGGGRYDGLVKEFGGADTPAVGVGMGIERALIALEAAKALPEAPRPEAFVIAAGKEAEDSALALARELRQAGLAALTDPNARSLKSQLGQADKAKARLALILGTDEIEKGIVQVRVLDASERMDVPRAEIVQKVRELI